MRGRSDSERLARPARNRDNALVPSKVTVLMRISHDEKAKAAALSAYPSGIAHRIATSLSSAWAFVAGAVVILAWAITGPLFGFSQGWQSAMTSGTSIVTFLMVLVLQHTETRQTRAMQLKRDELLRGVVQARTKLVHLEEQMKELDSLEKEFHRLRKTAR
jgi:low affinity Fe/Cu permease